MAFSNTIEAIKALRTLFEASKLIVNVDTNSVDKMIISFHPYRLGLKEAKDFVEACMELAREDNHYYEVYMIVEGMYPEVRHCGDYKTLQIANDACDEFRRLDQEQGIWDRYYKISLSYFSKPQGR